MNNLRRKRRWKKVALGGNKRERIKQKMKERKKEEEEEAFVRTH